MPNYDDILQNSLHNLEKGLPLDAVMRDLPEDAEELSGLIRLAAAVRAIPHPEPQTASAQAQRQTVMREAVSLPPLARPRPFGSTQPTQPIRTNRSLWGVFTHTVPVRAAAFLLILVLAAAAVGLWKNASAMDTARVENVVGQVQVAESADESQWKNLSNGDRLREGQRIRALGASSATLVFYEGTRTMLAANSDITLTELNGSSGQSIRVEMAQNLGETRHKVTPFKGSRSSFLVRTASGAASVHGTTFSVRVNANGGSQFMVNTGEVRVQSDLEEVTLLAGQATMADTEGAIEDPNYTFSITGSLMAMEEDAWTVSGMRFLVSESTVINGPFELGNTVRVTGRILKDSVHQADTIDPAPDTDQNASFTGMLEAMEGETWLVSGKEVLVNTETLLDEGLAVGDPVRVTFNLLADGSWLALSIEKLTEEPPDTEPTPTATADPNAMPSYEFSPDELSISECGTGERARLYTLNGSLSNTSNDVKDYAANVQLGYLIDQGGEYVSMVKLDPDGWTRLEAGQTVGIAIQVTMNEAWASAPDDAQVKLRIFVASATNRPDHLQGRLTVTIYAGCEVTPTPGTPTTTSTVTETVTATATATATPQMTGTATALTPTAVTPTATPSAEPTANQCTGAEPHPTGLTLAQRYGVPYEEIMFWFCQHYGFGEIDLAYSLARQVNIPVEQVFAMRASGLGWGQIKQQLLNGEKLDKNQGGKPDKEDKNQPPAAPQKPKDKGKNKP